MYMIRCRVCHSTKKDLKQIYIMSNEKLQSLFAYSYRDKYSKGYFCKNCGSISFFASNKINYGDGSFRRRGSVKTPPVELPWSTITYKRHIHISRFIRKLHNQGSKYKFNNLLDFGGYNGFTAYGICQEFGIDFKNAFIADLDPNGLSIAQSLGFSTYDLRKKSLSEHLLNDNKDLSLITAVHVLEHLDDPSEFFSSIKEVSSSNTIVYVEIPSRYFFPLGDPAHLITFSRESMISLALRFGFELIYSNSIKTPSEAVRYNYPFSSNYESQAFVFKYNSQIKIQKEFIPSTRAYSFVGFCIFSAISNVSLRFIIFINYSKIIYYFLIKLIKSILMLILSPFSALIYAVKSLL